MRIETWFPTSIMVCEDFQSDSIDQTIIHIKEWINKHGSVRQSIFEVDSTHMTNDKMHLDGRFVDLADKILTQAKEFAKEFGYSKTALDNLGITNMWSNISNEGDFLASHIHQNSFLSGVYYLQAPKDSKIIFYDHSDMSMIPEILTPLSFTNATYDCIPGRLLMWKSSLQHGTPKQPPGQEKIIISFNITFLTR